MNAAPAALLPEGLRALHPKIGVEVSGLDLAKPIDQPTVTRLKELWERHYVLLFRDQDLTEEQQIAFTRRFGDLAIYTDDDKRSSRNPEIVRIANVDEHGNKLDPNHYIHRYYSTRTALWHTDGSYKAIPSLGSTLHAIEVPDEGGETCFANTVAAYEALSPALKARIEGKHLVHCHEFTRLFAPGLPPMSEAQKRELPPVTHPVVRTHADGRKGLYISANVAYYIGGMPLEDGIKLHGELITWATQPEFVYTHKWRRGDFLMWDNRGTMHRVCAYDPIKYRRVMRRTELMGTEIPV